MNTFIEKINSILQTIGVIVFCLSVLLGAVLGFDGSTILGLLGGIAIGTGLATLFYMLGNIIKKPYLLLSFLTIPIGYLIGLLWGSIGSLVGLFIGGFIAFILLLRFHDEDFYKIKEGKNELGYNRNLEPDLRLATSEEINKGATTKNKPTSTILGIDPVFIKMLFAFLIITFLWYSYSPFFDNPINVRIGALCKDGFNSNATGSGACSYHEGVSEWQYKEIPHETGWIKKIFISIICGFTLTFPVLGLLSGVKEKFSQ